MTICDSAAISHYGKAVPCFLGHFQTCLDSCNYTLAESFTIWPHHTTSVQRWCVTLVLTWSICSGQLLLYLSVVGPNESCLCHVSIQLTLRHSARVFGEPNHSRSRFIFHFVFCFSELPSAVLQPASLRGSCFICGKAAADAAASPNGSKQSWWSYFLWKFCLNPSATALQLVSESPLSLPSPWSILFVSWASILTGLVQFALRHSTY